MPEFKQYRRKQLSQLCPYEEGMSLEGVNIDPNDAAKGSPKVGDMIARNPDDHSKKWLVEAQFFTDNFETA